jgi:uncharacterized membrane protein
MNDVVPLVLIGALVTKVIDFLKFLRGGLYGDAMTQLVVWVAGIGVVFLFAETQWANVGLVDLSTANPFDKLVLGLQASSVFGVVNDYRKAFDSTDSAKTPSLFPNDPPTP